MKSYFVLLLLGCITVLTCCKEMEEMESKGCEKPGEISLGEFIFQSGEQQNIGWVVFEESSTYGPISTDNIPHQEEIDDIISTLATDTPTFIEKIDILSDDQANITGIVDFDQIDTTITIPGGTDNIWSLLYPDSPITLCENEVNIQQQVLFYASTNINNSFVFISHRTGDNIEESIQSHIDNFDINTNDTLVISHFNLIYTK